MVHARSFMWCLLWVGLSACNGLTIEKQTNETIVSGMGVVKKIADTYVIEAISISGNLTRYVPRNLDAAFQQENLSVRFEGKVLPIPPNVRMIGNPIELKSIKKNP